MAASRIRPGDRLSEAGRLLVRVQFERLMANLPAVREGSDPDAVRRARVAVRRMRTALRLLQAAYDPRCFRQMSRRLRACGEALGAVRDGDVLLSQIRAFVESLPGDARPAFTPLLEHLEQTRSRARRALDRYLDSKQLRRLLDRLREFSTTPGAGAAQPPNADPDHPLIVSHVLPALIWGAFGQVRAYQGRLSGASLADLHRLRIRVKRLRYLLEFFSDVLGEEVAGPIAAARRLQDHLGAISDAAVLRAAVSAWVEANSPDGYAEPLIACLSATDAEIAHLSGSLRAPWQSLTGVRARRALGLASSRL